MKKLLVTLVLLGVILTAGTYWYSQVRSRAVGDESFTLIPVEWGTLTETVSATGILQPQEIIAVGCELSGRVVEFYSNAEINQLVQEGDPLLKLDDRLALIKLEQARTAVRLALANVQMAEAARDAAALRVVRLREVPQDVGLRKELDEAEMQLKSADAAVVAAKVKVEEAQVAQQQAQFGLELTVVRANAEPSDSTNPALSKRRYTIIDRKVVLGQLIAPPASAQLFTLASHLERMRVHVQVGENDIGRMRAGLTATFTVYAYPEEDARFEGKVVEIRPMPSNLQGAVFFDTVIDVTNRRDPKTQEWELRPGMTAAVDFILRRHADVWKVPTAALSFQLDERYQTEEARAKLARWQSRSDREEWKPVWVVTHEQKPWPIFVRIGGKNAAGETGIKDGQFNEVLQWDPELKQKPDPKVPASFPHVITGAPAVTKQGLFDRPNMKLF